MNMIEKAARATFISWRNHMDETGCTEGPKTYDDLDEQEKTFACGAAKAIIEALKEPTKEMLYAKRQCDHEAGQSEYELMIEAALKE